MKSPHLRGLGQLAMAYLRPYAHVVLGVVLALSVTSGSVLLLGWEMRHLVDDGFGARDHARLDRALATLLAAAAALALATFGRVYLVTWLGERVAADLRRDVYARLIRLSPGFFETRKAGEIVSRMTADIAVLQMVTGSALSVAARNILLLAGGVAMLLITSPSLFLYTAIMVPLTVFPVLLTGRRVRALSRAAQDKVAALSARAEETISAVKAVQAYTCERREEEAFGAAAEESFQAAMRRVKLRGFLTALVILLVFSAVGLVLRAGGHDVLSGEMSAGALASFLFYSVLVAGAFGALGEVAGDLQRGAGAAEALAELLSAQSPVMEIPAPGIVPVPPAPEHWGEEALRLENVTFYYPSRPDAPALSGVSLAVRSGERLAVVGPSGAGKSTLFQLLLRFYDPSAGAITIGGADLRHLRLQDLRRQFAYVAQDPVIFSATVRENIAYGAGGADEKDIVAAAEAARAWDFVRRLPGRLDTYVGEKGVRLSGGERQRIAIARALLRNPRFLLLDEATSALDSENENLVQEALKTLMTGRTTLVIAHRLATVMEADRIAVLYGGRIEAVGTHAELLKSCPLYRDLAELQFRPESLTKG